jgi:hypothetical protein
VEFAARAGNKDSARSVAFAVFYAFYDPGRLAAFRAIGALGGVHDFLAVRRFGDFSHDSIFSWDVGFPRPFGGGNAVVKILGDGTPKAVRRNDRNNYDFTLSVQFSSLVLPEAQKTGFTCNPRFGYQSIRLQHSFQGRR